MSLIGSFCVLVLVGSCLAVMFGARDLARRLALGAIGVGLLLPVVLAVGAELGQELAAYAPLLGVIAGLGVLGLLGFVLVRQNSPERSSSRPLLPRRRALPPAPIDEEE